ncbi:hypothetical protein HYV72_00400 [Candidatus Uhrbacteria bacterium]|nr:hypothetical protein [Candidatus Uhrbacteria bacterium]
MGRVTGALIFALSLLCYPQVSLAFNPNFLLSDADMTNARGLSQDAIQRFLESKSGTLGAYMTADLDGVVKRASEIIARVSDQFIVNPKFVLVLLQKEQSLVTDASPLPTQYDWAVGYGVCDGCSVAESGVARFRGFAKQLDSMAQQFRFGYLADLEAKGVTQSNIGPGRTVVIDGEAVTPENHATSALYTYTPHMEGNQNFWNIWQEWFESAKHPSGTVLQDMQDKSLWLIQGGARRFIPSVAVLSSYASPDRVIPVDTAQILSYTEGAPLSFPNYALVRIENGDVYLLVNGDKRRFQSLDDLPRFGYVPDEILNGTSAELAPYKDGSTITYQTENPQGAVVKDTTTGGLYYVDQGVRRAIVHTDILRDRYSAWRVRPASHEDLTLMREVDAVRFSEGTLVKVANDPTVYVISEGRRRPIIDESTFVTLGFEWKDILTTSPAAIEVHPPGDLIQWP